MSKPIHQWRVESTSINHNYWIVDDERVIAQRMKKRDAERIVRCVNEHAALVRRVGEYERTVKMLRAYIRSGEVSVLNSIRRGIWQEGV
jgi:hypothetical protein